jgi:hypothetical protein
MANRLYRRRSAAGTSAAHHGLTVLHDDADYRTVARHASDLSEHNIHDVIAPVRGEDADR